MQFTTEVLPKDREGIDFYVAKYRPFRLRALKAEPSCFGSTYAREIAFTEEQWEQRLLNPIATVLLAVSGTGDARQILSSATLVELPVPGDLVGVPDRVLCGGDSAPSHWVVNAVYTAPEARRLGISTELMAAAARDAQAKASAQGRDCLLTVLVAKDNAGAKALYEKCGYVVSNELDNRGGEKRLQLFLYLPRSLQN